MRMRGPGVQGERLLNLLYIIEPPSARRQPELNTGRVGGILYQGSQMRKRFRQQPTPQALEIIGVVGDVPRNGLDADTPYQVYASLNQRGWPFAKSDTERDRQEPEAP